MSIALVLAIVGLSVTTLVLNVQINDWRGKFYNALQDRDLASFTAELERFCVLVLLWCLSAQTGSYLRKFIQINWRRWLSAKLYRNWLRKRDHPDNDGRLTTLDNPDQRLAEDVDAAIALTLDLSVSLLNAALTLTAFGTMLWSLSRPVTIGPVTIPAFMTLAAIAYALCGSLTTHWIGRGLVPLNVAKQACEANFRFTLMRLRSSSGSPHEVPEPSELDSRFARVSDNWMKIILRHATLGSFTGIYSQFQGIASFILTAPQYFAGQITLGDVVQTGATFLAVVGTLSWFMNSYSSFVTWRTATARLFELMDALFDHPEPARAAGPSLSSV